MKNIIGLYARHLRTILKAAKSKADAEKGSGYFVKLFSSAYGGTVENNFAKSKQCQEKFDVFLGIFMVVFGQPMMPVPALFCG